MIRNKEDHIRLLLDSLHNYQRSGMFADVKIVCSNGCVYAHAVVLATFVPALSGAALPAKIELKSSTVETVNMFLTYVYTGSVEVGAGDSSVDKKLNFLFQSMDQAQISGFPLCEISEVFSHFNRSEDSTSRGARKNPVKNESDDTFVEEVEGRLNEELKKGRHRRSNRVLNKDLLYSKKAQETSRFSPRNLTKRKGSGTKSQIQSKKAKESEFPTRHDEILDDTGSGDAAQTTVNMEIDGNSLSPPPTCESEMDVTKGKDEFSMCHTNETTDVDLGIGNSTETLTSEDDGDFESSFTDMSCKGKSMGAFKTVTPETANLPKYNRKHKKLEAMICEHCDETLKGYARLILHMNQKHSIPYKKKDVENHLFTCNEGGCSYTAATEAVLLRHIKYDHKGVKREKKVYHYCEYCGYKAEKKILDVHVAMEHTEQGQLKECPHCQVSFHPKFIPIHIYRKHKHYHTFLCSHCNYKCSNNRNLFRYHLYSQHEDTSEGMPTMHTCSECDYEHHSWRMVIDHHKIKHQVEPGLAKKDFECEQCKKRFATAKHLRLHKLIHNQSKKHKCEFCDFTSPTKSRVRRHINVIHSTNRFHKPWACSICDFTTNVKWTLKAHIMNKHKQSKQLADKLVTTVEEKLSQCR